MPTNAQVLKTAISQKQQVKANYDGYYRELCPHAIGWKNGAYHVISFQFAGQSSRPLPPGGQWKCMDVDRLEIVSVSDGPWHTNDDHTRPQTCIDNIELEVAH